MPIKTRRWDDPQEPDDGFRVLVCRYRPRGLPKSGETWDVWWPQLAPSRELHAAFYGKGQSPIPWEVYRPSYLREMQAQEDKIRKLATLVAAGQTITLLCSSACTRESRCHRSLLKELIEQRAETGCT